MAAASSSNDHVRLFAVSDVHVENEANARWIESLSDTAYKKDAIIVAGDVCDDLETLMAALVILRSKFAAVYFTAGNHDLWLSPGETDSLSKLNTILQRCEAAGVTVGAGRVGTPYTGVWVCPLLSWHHKTFDTEPDLQGFAIPPVEQCMSDYRNTRFAKPLDPHTDAVAKAFDVLNEDVVAKLPAARTEPLVTFSHFLPRVELLPEKRYLTLPVLAKASGSSFLHERILALQPTMHAFGHTHFGWDAKLDDGVRYVQAALAYPGERISRWHTLKVGDFGADGPLLLWSSKDGFAPHMHCRWSGFYEVHRREPERVWELATYAARQWAKVDERASYCTPDFSHEDGAGAVAGVRMLQQDPAFVKPS